ncbi:hypothetical protein CTI12_AA576340 [Artemisia annua]|uniref:Ubiquitin-like protease family profile domain-containing protein n=1 Tax=Artemisia annua TaxID=35608 RepID=A0A2U1KM47_ARTAN|nr:hypothetical protein CTI12_AA576340 [Artemisia annua]
MNVQSLAPGLKIETPVIDTFASILNYEEWLSYKKLKRHYFYTSMMQLPGIIQNEPQCMLTKIDKQYDEFAKMITIQMEDDIRKLQFEDVNLVFFPIISHDLYYLIVFNIIKGTSVIIDNSDSDGTYEGKYKENYEFVRGVFAKHLTTYQHPKGDELMNQKRKPTILNMSWRTKKDKIDCGLYMMLHMEHYQGKSGTKWDTGMLKENDINHKMQINNLRAKYVAKMMLHEVNDNQKMMSDYALKFASENPDEEEAKTLL